MIGLIILGVYAFGAFFLYITGIAYMKAMEKKNINAEIDEGFLTLFAAFWPIALPAFLFLFIAEFLSDLLSEYL